MHEVPLKATLKAKHSKLFLDKFRNISHRLILQNYICYFYEITPKKCLAAKAKKHERQRVERNAYRRKGARFLQAIDHRVNEEKR